MQSTGEAATRLTGAGPRPGDVADCAACVCAWRAVAANTMSVVTDITLRFMPSSAYRDPWIKTRSWGA